MNWKLPNLLTLGRLALSILFFVLLALSRAGEDPSSGLLTAGLVIYIIAGATDVLDGHLARKWQVQSAFGRIADPFVDKVMVCGGFALLAGVNFAMVGPAPSGAADWLHGAMASGVQAWMVVVLVGREFIVSGIRGYSESQGVKFPATPAGKIKMLVQSIALSASLVKMAWLNDVAWAEIAVLSLVWLTVAVTVLSSLGYVGRTVRVMKMDEKPG
jgi:phosphatidylglycerophosphate synthase